MAPYNAAFFIPCGDVRFLVSFFVCQVSDINGRAGVIHTLVIVVHFRRERMRVGMWLAVALHRALAAVAWLHIMPPFLFPVETYVFWFCFFVCQVSDINRRAGVIHILIIAVLFRRERMRVGMWLAVALYRALAAVAWLRIMPPFSFPVETYVFWFRFLFVKF